MAPFLDGLLRASYVEMIESLKKYWKKQNSYDDIEIRGFFILLCPRNKICIFFQISLFSTFYSIFYIVTILFCVCFEYTSLV